MGVDIRKTDYDPDSDSDPEVVRSHAETAEPVIAAPSPFMKPIDRPDALWLPAKGRAAVHGNLTLEDSVIRGKRR